MEKTLQKNSLAKLFGGILLIIGTSMGGGMLALPLATATTGFAHAVILFLFCWAIMTASAFFILEANLWLEEDANLISMAGATIGRTGQWIAWFTYIFLLYSLIAAYLASGRDIVNQLFSGFHLHIPSAAALLLFLTALSSIVYQGIHSVDRTNRWIMSSKLLSFFLILLFLIPGMRLESLLPTQSYPWVITTFSIIITSFGYAIIVPSLRSYFHSDPIILRRILFIGSLIPLICYLLWEAAIFSLIPLEGPYGLLAIQQSSTPIKALMIALNIHTKTHWAALIANAFTTLSVATSFLGVSLCLFDFFSDGFHFKKEGIQRIGLYLMTFLPPLLLVQFFPNFFLLGLRFAGICCVILLMLLPAWMVWRGRYHKRYQSTFQVIGGKPLLLFVLISSIGLMITSLYALWN